MKLMSIITGAEHFVVRYPKCVTFTRRVSWRRAKFLQGKFGGWIIYDPLGHLACDINYLSMTKCPLCSKEW